ncbi:DUF5777 family beta-barrel protein [Bacteroidota bacterium]
MKKLLFAIFMLLAGGNLSFSQDLMDMFGDDENTINYTIATFKSTRVVNGQSVMNTPGGELIFIIGHRFGQLNGGPYELFGLDQSFIRFGLEYGIADWLTIGFGRSSYQKLYDGFYKIRLLRQSTGSRTMPVSVNLFSNVSLNSLKWQDTERANYNSSRLNFTHQLLIARKFNNAISLQLSPTMIHRNMVPAIADQNDVFAIGGGGRFKLTQRMSINAEYFYMLPGKTADDYVNVLSLGIDLETGGHVFQFILSNSQGMVEQVFIPKTTGKWLDGGIHLGFNISRIFTLKKQHSSL